MKLLISGYYGFDNLGDEAVLGGLLAGLHAEWPDATPVVLSGNPAATEAQHGVAALPRMSLAAIRQALADTDLFISGGGSLLQDVTSFKSPLYYLGLLWLAQRAGVPTMLLAQGIGPLNHPANRLLARRVLNNVQAITVRDEGSVGYLQELGVTRPPVEVTADPSFLLQPRPSSELTTWWDAHIPADRPLIGVALRPWQGGKSEVQYTAIADSLAALAAHTGAMLLFIPMQHDVDMGIAEAVAGWTPAESRVLPLRLSPQEMLTAVGRCDFILAMRLHTLIFAVQRGVPALGLAYDPKVLDFSIAAGLPLPSNWEDITAEALTTQLMQEWEERATVQDQLHSTAQQLTALASRNIARVGEIIGTKKKGS